MEKLLNQQVVQQIGEAFAEVDHPVQILFFGSEENCEYCDQTQQLLSEVSEISDKVGLSIYDLKKDAAVAAHYKVDKAPAIVIASADGDQIVDLGVQFSGIPAGYEFSSLINDIIIASKRDSGLSSATRDYLKTLTHPLLLRVFVTPT